MVRRSFQAHATWEARKDLIMSLKFDGLTAAEIADKVREHGFEPS